MQRSSTCINQRTNIQCMWGFFSFPHPLIFTGLCQNCFSNNLCVSVTKSSKIFSNKCFGVDFGCSKIL